tara:strand:+ start:147 stop:674 length:528 start_codon:yes stop_codon:yes gene_type:complete
MSGTHRAGINTLISNNRLKEIQKAVYFIDKTPDMHGSDPGCIGSERADYFEWAIKNLLETIKRDKPLDIHDEACICGQLINKNKNGIYFSSRAIKYNALLGLYDIHYYIIEFTQALTLEHEWDKLVSITNPYLGNEKPSMFDYLPDDQKVFVDINLEEIISAPFDWKWEINTRSN